MVKKLIAHFAFSAYALADWRSACLLCKTLRMPVTNEAAQLTPDIHWALTEEPAQAVAPAVLYCVTLSLCIYLAFCFDLFARQSTHVTTFALVSWAGVVSWCCGLVLRVPVCRA